MKMKRKSILALLLILCLVFCFTLTACGGNSGGSSSGSQDPVEEAEEEALEEAEEEVETLESMMAKDSEINDAIYASVEGQEALSVEVKGNDIILTCEMTKLSGQSADAFKSDAVIDSLNEGMESGKDNFVQSVQNIEQEAGLTGIRYIIQYTADGEVLTSRTFNSEGME